MNKTKVKIGLFVLLSLIGLTAGFFFSGYLNLLFSGGSVGDLSAIQPAKIFTGVLSDGRQRMLTLCVGLVIEAGIAALALLSRKETFESDVVSVTNGIKTPIAIGQGQHGTARWMKADEKRMAFSVYRLDSRETTYSKLLKEGRLERREVLKYPDEPDKSVYTDNKDIAEGGDGAPAAQTEETKS